MKNKLSCKNLRLAELAVLILGVAFYFLPLNLAWADMQYEYKERPAQPPQPQKPVPAVPAQPGPGAVVRPVVQYENRDRPTPGKSVQPGRPVVAQDPQIAGGTGVRPVVQQYEMVQRYENRDRR